MNSIQRTVVFKKRAREKKNGARGINTSSGENVDVQNINAAVEVEDWVLEGRRGGRVLCCLRSKNEKKNILLDIQNKYGLDFKGPVRL